jgi:hypothetical protein
MELVLLWHCDWLAFARKKVVGEIDRIITDTTEHTHLSFRR